MRSNNSLVLLVIAICFCSYVNAQDIINVAPDDPEMLEAVQQARESVDDFIQALNENEDEQTGFAVKRKFTQGDQVEYMWLTDVRYKDGIFDGQLDNDPRDLTNVQAGERFQVNKEEIWDWIIFTEDGMVGGYSVKLLLKRQREEKMRGIEFQAFEADESTPQGTILLVEKAYRENDIETVLKYKDFELEAKLMLEKNSPELANQDEVVATIAGSLATGFRKEIEATGFPDFSNATSEFSEAQPYPDGNDDDEDLVYVIEKVTFEDGQVQTERVVLAKSGEGWKLVTAPEN